MERFSPSTTVSVKAYPMCIFTSCLAREMMASEGSFGRDNTTKMKQPSSICRKHFDLSLPGSALPDCMMYRHNTLSGDHLQIGLPWSLSLMYRASRKSRG